VRSKEKLVDSTRASTELSAEGLNEVKGKSFPEITSKVMKITIVAHPNSKKPRVEKDLFGNLHIYVGEPPLEGKANKAIIDSLARYFHIKRSDILLVSGEKSKNKTFKIIQ